MYRNFARYNWKRMAHLQPYVFQKYLSGNFYFFLLALTKMQNFIQNSTNIYRTHANKGRGFYSKTIFSALHNCAF